jgi:hypothetical protein
MLLGFLVAVTTAQAGLNVTEVRAAYLLKLTKFITWPEEAFSGDELVIGVIGENPFGSLLRENTAGKQVDGKALVIRYFDSIEDAGWQRSHLLYVADSERDQMERIIDGVQEWTVTISDIPEFPHKGGMIGFQDLGATVKMKVNNDVVQSNGLRISALVLKMVVLVEGFDR